MLFGRVERKQKVQLEDSTGFEDLQAQFDSADNRRQTVRQQVSDYNGLGPGRIIIKGKTNTPEGIFFYPDDPDFDIIVVDDGSTDDTYEKAISFAYHPLVTVLSQQNHGI